MAEYNDVRVVGFDLDQTLYPKSPIIDEAIQAYIYQKIAEHLNCGLEAAGKCFDDLYQNGRGLSGSKTLAAIGVPNSNDIVQEALEFADIAQFLLPDPKTTEILQWVNNRYDSTDLITGSNRANLEIKLGSIGIPEGMFGHIISADDASKSTGEAYELWMSCYLEMGPPNFMYVGDRVESDYQAPKQLGIRAILVNVERPDFGLDCPQLPDLWSLKRYLEST